MHDVLIIGGGPAGMNAALILARACRIIALIDSGTARNSVSRGIHGFLTRDGITPAALRQAGRGDLRAYDVEVIEDRVSEVEAITTRDADRFPTAFAARTRSGKVEARKLLLATGQCDIVPDLPGLRECYGVSVHHCPYCDGWEHRGGRLIAYATEAEAAAKLGLTLRSWSDEITVLTDGAAIEPADARRLARHGINCETSGVVRVLHIDGGLKGVALDDARIVPADALFFHSQQHPATQLAQQLGVEFPSEFARTDAKQRTNIPGVFLAGDIDGDVEFAIVAAAEGATAAVTIHRELIEEDRG